MLYEYWLPLCLVFALLLAGLYVSSKVRYGRLRKARSSITYDDFRRGVGGLASEKVIRTTYDFLARWIPKGVPILPSDELGDVFGITGEDIPEQIHELADTCEVPRPSEEDCYKVGTVADVVRLLGSLESASPHAARPRADKSGNDENP